MSFDIFDLINSDNSDTDKFWFEMVEQLTGESMEQIEVLNEERRRLDEMFQEAGL